MSLTGKTLASTYPSLLKSASDSDGIDATTRNITDGEGTASALSLSDDQLAISPQTHDTTGTLKVTNAGGGIILSVDTTNSLVRVNSTQQIANTAVKQFMLSSVNGNPATTNTWTMLDATGGGRFNAAPIEMGTASAPSLAYTNTANAMNLVQSIW